MPVDKAFEEWVDLEASKEEKIFARNHERLNDSNQFILAIGFHGGYHAKKYLSPEVRAVLEKVEILLGMFSYVKREGTPWANISAEVRFGGFMQLFEEVKNLLEAGE